MIASVASGVVFGGSGGSLTIAGTVDSTITIGSTGNVTFSVNTINLNNDLTIGSGASVGTTTGSQTANFNFGSSSTINLGSATRKITLGTSGVVNINGLITGSSTAGLTLGAGSMGTLVFNGTTAHTYPGPTTLSGGSLGISNNELIPNTSQMVFNGGTFKTNGKNETVATLQVTDNSNIILTNAVSHTLTFSASNGVSWTSGKTLTITNWNGGYDGTSGTAGKIFIGSDASGLTAGQLAQIRFLNAGDSQYYTATLLSTGELVPTATVLPISLASFTGSSSLSGNQLNWSTASEQNNSHFEILRSGENKVFSTIGTVSGNGTTSITSQYSFLDKSPLNGINYYELKQVDFDGKSKIYGPIYVKSKLESTAALSVYGSASDLNVSFDSDIAEQGNLKCFDLNGRLLLNKSVSLQKGNNSFKINELSEASSGIYILIMKTSSGTQKIKFSL